jgi:hypothetical protein
MQCPLVEQAGIFLSEATKVILASATFVPYCASRSESTKITGKNTLA